MPTKLLRGLAIAATVLVCLAISSTAPAHAVRPARAHAVHRTSTHRRVSRKSKAKPRAQRKRTAKPPAQKKSGARVRAALPQTAYTVDGTVLLGETAVESAYDYLVAGEAEAFRTQASLTGTSGAAHLYIAAGSTAKTVVAGLYTASGGHPGMLLSTGSAPASRAGTWTTVTLTQARLSAGGTYWLAVLGEGGTLRYRDRADGSCPSETSAQSTLGALPASWKTGTTYKDCPASAYVTTSAVGPPVSELSPAAPANTAPPVISGSPVEGQTLSTSVGSWSGSPTSYFYQWQDCNAFGEGCMSIAGASSSSYTLAAGDVGGTVRVGVTATNAGRSGRCHLSCDCDDLGGAARRSREHGSSSCHRFTCGRSDAEHLQRLLVG